MQPKARTTRECAWHKAFNNQFYFVYVIVVSALAIGSLSHLLTAKKYPRLTYPYKDINVSEMRAFNKLKAFEFISENIGFDKLFSYTTRQSHKSEQTPDEDSNNDLPDEDDEGSAERDDSVGNCMDLIRSDQLNKKIKFLVRLKPSKGDENEPKKKEPEDTIFRVDRLHQLKAFTDEIKSALTLNLNDMQNASGPANSTDNSKIEVMICSLADVLSEHLKLGAEFNRSVQSVASLKRELDDCFGRPITNHYISATESTDPEKCSYLYNLYHSFVRLGRSSVKETVVYLVFRRSLPAERLDLNYERTNRIEKRDRVRDLSGGGGENAAENNNNVYPDFYEFKHGELGRRDKLSLTVNVHREVKLTELSEQFQQKLCWLDLLVESAHLELAEMDYRDDQFHAKCMLNNLDGKWHQFWLPYLIAFILISPFIRRLLILLMFFVVCFVSAVISLNVYFMYNQDERVSIHGLLFASMTLFVVNLSDSFLWSNCFLRVKQQSNQYHTVSHILRQISYYVVPKNVTFAILMFVPYLSQIEDIKEMSKLACLLMAVYAVVSFVVYLFVCTVLILNPPRFILLATHYHIKISSVDVNELVQKIFGRYFPNLIEKCAKLFLFLFTASAISSALCLCYWPQFSMNTVFLESYSHDRSQWLDKLQNPAATSTTESGLSRQKAAQNVNIYIVWGVHSENVLLFAGQNRSAADSEDGSTAIFDQMHARPFEQHAMINRLCLEISSQIHSSRESAGFYSSGAKITGDYLARNKLHLNERGGYSSSSSSSSGSGQSSGPSKSADNILDELNLDLKSIECYPCWLENLLPSKLDWSGEMNPEETRRVLAAYKSLDVDDYNELAASLRHLEELETDAALKRHCALTTDWTSAKNGGGRGGKKDAAREAEKARKFAECHQLWAVEQLVRSRLKHIALRVRALNKSFNEYGLRGHNYSSSSSSSVVLNRDDDDDDDELYLGPLFARNSSTSSAYVLRIRTNHAASADFKKMYDLYDSIEVWWKFMAKKFRLNDDFIWLAAPQLKNLFVQKRLLQLALINVIIPLILLLALNIFVCSKMMIAVCSFVNILASVLITLAVTAAWLDWKINLFNSVLYLLVIVVATQHGLIYAVSYRYLPKTNSHECPFTLHGFSMLAIAFLVSASSLPLVLSNAELFSRVGRVLLVANSVAYICSNFYFPSLFAVTNNLLMKNSVKKLRFRRYDTDSLRFERNNPSSGSRNSSQINRLNKIPLSTSVADQFLASRASAADPQELVEVNEFEYAVLDDFNKQATKQNRKLSRSFSYYESSKVALEIESFLNKQKSQKRNTLKVPGN